MITVTLKSIKKENPCGKMWEALLGSLRKTKEDDTEVEIEYILNLLGLDDALWALRALPQSHQELVRFLLCDFASESLKHLAEIRMRKAMDVARAFASGNARLENLWEEFRFAWQYRNDALNAVEAAERLGDEMEIAINSGKACCVAPVVAALGPTPAADARWAAEKAAKSIAIAGVFAQSSCSKGNSVDEFEAAWEYTWNKARIAQERFLREFAKGVQV